VAGLSGSLASLAGGAATAKQHGARQQLEVVNVHMGPRGAEARVKRVRKGGTGELWRRRRRRRRLSQRPFPWVVVWAHDALSSGSSDQPPNPLPPPLPAAASSCSMPASSRPMRSSILAAWAFERFSRASSNCTVHPAATNQPAGQPSRATGTERERKDRGGCSLSVCLSVCLSVT
jgi:hypothetical protein